ncbi:GAF domain-containing protein [Coleofasciculus sp. FACHB-SPT9]|uniref:sensor histidine kinase n=1 Tax=Cyanophyceae TaxID=3028117 RepID=UPI0016893C38|nr:GAF domain-containing protein [Coleofasciculus sp. FACHB-SPT9]MBD1888009.1 GAF domain-containing protein [Coleofasciculus sp. FACHB-SPT9]
MDQHHTPDQSPADYENQLVALGRVLQTMREEENVDVLIETTLNYLASEFDYRLIWIGLYDRLDHRLFGKGGVTPTGDTKFLKSKFTLSPGDLLEQVVIQQRSLGVPNLSEEVRAGEWRRAAQQFGIQGAFFYPLRCKDRCFGVVLLGSSLWGATPRPGEKAQMSMLFGGLAAALYQIELDWQHSSTKRPDQPLFQVLDQMARMPAMDQRLEAVVAMTQQFIGPTRTSVYWYSPERRYFWHRVGNRQTSRGLASSAASAAAGLTVQEVSEFYLALNENRLIAIGAGRSPLKAEVTGRLLSRLRARSLLAAPIRVKQELVGFLAVEGNEARIWEEAEKNYIRAAAQLISLGAGSEEIEGTLERTQQDAQLVAECARILADNTNAEKALDECAQLLLKRLGAERFLVLQQPRSGHGSWFGNGGQDSFPITPGSTENSKQKAENYSVVYQRQPLNRRPLTTSLSAVTGADRQLIEESPEAVAIEDWEQDPRLGRWRESLAGLGVRSLLVCRMSSRNASELDPDLKENLPLVVIGHNTPRTWNQTERQLLGIVSQQLSLAVRTLEMRTSTQLSESAQSFFQAGLKILLSAPPDPAGFDRAWVEFLSEMLQSPLALLLTWGGTRKDSRIENAKVAAAVMANSRFALPPDLSVPLNDALIQEALTTEGLLEKRGTQIPGRSRQWLSSASIGCLLVMALPQDEGGRTKEETTPLHPSGGLVVLADSPQRQWPEHLLPVVETLIGQFARIRQYTLENAALYGQVRNLEQLNWYKHRCMASLHSSAADRLNRLNQLVGGGLSDIPLGEQTNRAESSVPSKGHPPDKSLARMHSSQLIRELGNILGEFAPLVEEEQWQLKRRLTKVPLVNVLKRSLWFVQPLYHQRQIQVSIGGVGSNLHVYSDLLKLECVLSELLAIAARKATANSRIHLKAEVKIPQEDSASLVELLMTDSERFDLTTPVGAGFHLEPTLKICQRFVRSFGGDLQFYQMEGHRYLTRLLLPMV